MSTWKRVGLELLPERSKFLTTEGQNPTAMWHGLYSECLRAHDEHDEDFLARLYEYAKWFLANGDDRLLRALYFSFIRHLPQRPDTRSDIKRYFDDGQIKELLDPLTWELNETEARALREEMLK